MKIFYLLIASAISFSSVAQMQPQGKVYIVEGYVADKETMQPVNDAVLFNDSLGITTTSDENGYFKIVVPLSMVLQHQKVAIDVIKKDYKKNGWGFTYNSGKKNVLANDSTGIEWNYDVKIIYLAKQQSTASANSSGGTRYQSYGEHGPGAVKKVFEREILEEQEQQKFDSLKLGNNKVVFSLGKRMGIATCKYDIILNKKPAYVYLDGKKIRTQKLNNSTSREYVLYDNKSSDSLSKQVGREILSFITVKEGSQSQASLKAILFIDL